jgi:hypothetical protein
MRSSYLIAASLAASVAGLALMNRCMGMGG